MSTKTFDLKNLSKKFHTKDLEWKPDNCGFDKRGEPWVTVVAHLNARAVMDRLDSVLGPENWKDNFEKAGDGFLGDISIFINGQWVTKKDGAEQTDLEPFKGGLSQAFKRAAVKWGIGRYLYEVPIMFANLDNVDPKKDKDAKMIRIFRHPRDKKGEIHYWVPPHNLPIEFLSDEEQGKRREMRGQSPKKEPKQEAIVEFGKTKKELQTEIATILRRMGITKKQLNNICAVNFNVNHQEDLNLEQLGQLIEILEEGESE